eukprot:scaffold258290_cov31-Tisochrysis_lutea.AAC.2
MYSPPAENESACLAYLGKRRKKTARSSRDQIVMRSRKSEVAKMCLPSGAHLTCASPSGPSSILQCQSGCSRLQTCATPLA